MWSDIANEWNAFVDLGEKENQDDRSNALGDNSSIGGVDVNLNSEQTTEVLNGGVGSGNFGHLGRPGEVGGSSKDSVFDNPWDAGDSYWRPLWDAELRPGQTYSEYYRDEKDLATKVIEIKPDDYLVMIQKGGHSVGITHEDIASDNPRSIAFHRELIQQGKPIATPTFRIESDGSIADQEGRHRIEAAKMEGIEKVPVMISYHPSQGSIDAGLSSFEYKDITDKYRKLITKHFKGNER